MGHMSPSQLLSTGIDSCCSVSSLTTVFPDFALSLQPPSFLLGRCPPHQSARPRPSWDNQQIWDNWVSPEVPLEPTVPLCQEESGGRKSERLAARSGGRAASGERPHAHQWRPCEVNKGS